MDSEQPFHEGELSIQKRLGVDERVAAFAPRLIRDHLTEEHQAFFPMLPTLLVGSRDEQGALWASMLHGEPGFIDTSDARRLGIGVLPLQADPLSRALMPGKRLGFLGLQFETRRRNRIAGRVEEAGRSGFSVAIDQTFGNCPKYIQTRAPVKLDVQPGPAHMSSQLAPADTALIEQADTFFIASGIEGADDDPRAGTDISHRGGRPGFVQVENNRLVWPDFVGNFLFNTLGNLAVDPRAGLLFIDFNSGDSLQLSGRAQVIWDADFQQGFPGAERFVAFTVEKALRIPAALPLRWEFSQASPFNARTGVWSELSGQDNS